MATNSDLSKAVLDVQTELADVTQDLQRRVDLNRRYKSENQTLQAYALELAAFQGKLKATDAVSSDDVAPLITESGDKIMPMISTMISTNTEVVGMGVLSLDKDLTSASATGLNDKLTDLQNEVLELYTELQSVSAGGGVDPDVPTTYDIKILAKPKVAPPPSLAQLASAFDTALSSIAYAKPPAEN